MKFFLRILLFSLFFFCLHNVYSQEADTDINSELEITDILEADIADKKKVDITDINLETCYRGVFTRGSGFLNEVSAIGALELIDMIAFRGGFSFGMTLDDIEINTFVSVNYSPFKKLPFTFSLLHIWNGLPTCEAHSNSIMPVVSYNARYAGLSLGANFRFTSYFREKAQFESVFSLYGYVNFVNNGTLRIGAGAGNFNDFQAKNLGAYSLNLFAYFKLNENWRITNNLEFMQSGGDGLSTTSYGIAFKAGATYSW